MSICDKCGQPVPTNSEVVLIDPRGMLRCCLATISSLPIKEHAEGEVMDCLYEPLHNRSLIFIGGMWHWNDPSAHYEPS